MTTEKRWAIHEDREIHVEPWQAVKTAWVDIDDCILGSKFRRSIGDIEKKYQKLLQMGDSAPFPPINGYWDFHDETGGRTRFVVSDGGHEFIASLALGRDRVFVCWLVDNSEATVYP